MTRLLTTLILLTTLTTFGQIRIAPTDFNLPTDELHTLLTATIQAFPDQKTPPLYLTRTNQKPITLYERTPRGEINIRLNISGRYYAQAIYQFAHEYAHVLANFASTMHENQWLEETLCETASLYALMHLSKEWRDNAPSDTHKNYRLKLVNYANKITYTRETLHPKSGPEFYEKNRTTLRKNAKNRALNGALANLILPYLIKEPKHWGALQTIPRTPGLTLSEHLTEWRNNTPAKHHPFLYHLEALLLTKTDPPAPRSLNSPESPLTPPLTPASQSPASAVAPSPQALPTKLRSKKD